MFENLENTLIEIKDELKLYRELFALQFDNLRTKNQVAKFLHKDPKTIYNWIKDGTLKEGIHLRVDNDGKTEFIPEGIIQLKKELRERKIEVKRVEKQLNPIANKFLNRRTVNV